MSRFCHFLKILLPFINIFIKREWCMFIASSVKLY